MSYSTMFVVEPAGRVREFERWDNAIRGALAIWCNLADRYLGGSEELVRLMLHDQQTLWRLATDPRLTINERIVHVCTFDRVIVRRGDFRRVADALEDFDREYPGTHCGAWARTLRLLEFRGACWRMTDVSDNLWIVDDDVFEGGRPYNVDVDREHFFLFDQYPELRARA